MVEMPVPRFMLKVKNTFIEAGKNEDDSSSDINDEDFEPRRQITEPAPPTLPLFESSIDEQIKVSPRKMPLETIKSIGDFKSLDIDVAENGHKTCEPFEPEWEPDFQQSYVGAEWPLSGTTYWSNWNDQPWEQDNSLTADQSSLSWQNAAPSMGYGMQPLTYPSSIMFAPMDANGGQGRRDRYDQVSANLESSNKSKQSNERMARRRRRESLIDVAARRQRNQANQAAKQQNRQAKKNPVASSTPAPAEETVGAMTKGTAPKFCSQCGDRFESHFKFCKICGVAVPST